MSSTAAHLVGVYTWEHPGGKFEVCLRANFVFYCQAFPAQGSWNFVEGNKLIINWKNYGNYELTLGANSGFEGSVVGIPAKWRKMTFLRPLSNAETVLLASQ